MITKFKIFENINLPPKVGDYVLLRNFTGVHDFYNKNIGKITSDNTLICVSFDVPQGMRIPSEIMASQKDIRCWSENKEELEIFMSANKYNL